jgi:hypothetical protein
MSMTAMTRAVADQDDPLPVVSNTYLPSMKRQSVK